MSVEKAIVVTCLMLGVSLALADDEEMPDPEFLEYLGTWEDSDEDWLIFRGTVKAEVDNERSEPVPEGEESTEKTDES